MLGGWWSREPLLTRFVPESSGYTWGVVKDYPLVATSAFMLNYIPWELTFYHYEMLLTWSLLHLILVYSYTGFLFFGVFVWNIFSHPFTFNSSVSIVSNNHYCFKYPDWQSLSKKWSYLSSCFSCNHMFEWKVTMLPFVLCLFLLFCFSISPFFFLDSSSAFYHFNFPSITC